jgi:integrase
MATIVKPTKVVDGKTVPKNPSKPWTCRYQDQGKQRERSFATSGQANDFKAKFEHDSRESIFVDPRNGKTDFVTYAGQWIDGLDRAESSRKAYRSILSSQIATKLAGRTLAQVAADREGVWTLISGADLSASRKSMLLWVIRGSLDEAVRGGRIPRHSLAGLSVKSDAQEPAQIIAATRKQLEMLADGLKPQLELLVWLMRGAGLRISEALAVNVAGFRDDGKTLRIHEQVSDAGTLVPLKHRRRGEFRDIPVPSWLWARVQAHAATYAPQDGFLFKFDGKHTTYKMSHPRFLKAAANAGLGGMTEHSLRHLFASVVLSAGIPITDLAAWLGHRNINVTFATYSHLLPDSWTRGREALEALED